MPRKEKKRTFESETLIMPALKMVLVEEKDGKKQTAKEIKQKADRDFTEETVLRIIGKLSSKD